MVDYFAKKQNKKNYFHLWVFLKIFLFNNVSSVKSSEFLTAGWNLYVKNGTLNFNVINEMHWN